MMQFTITIVLDLPEILAKNNFRMLNHTSPPNSFDSKSNYILYAQFDKLADNENLIPYLRYVAQLNAIYFWSLYCDSLSKREIDWKNSDCKNVGNVDWKYDDWERIDWKNIDCNNDNWTDIAATKEEAKQVLKDLVKELSKGDSFRKKLYDALDKGEFDEAETIIKTMFEKAKPVHDYQRNKGAYFQPHKITLGSTMLEKINKLKKDEKFKSVPSFEGWPNLRLDKKYFRVIP